MCGCGGRISLKTMKNPAKCLTMKLNDDGVFSFVFGLYLYSLLPSLVTPLLLSGMENVGAKK